MSNTDSFVDEVTDEVRRDRLFAMFRKYGWIGVVMVLLIVGGAAWTEWQKAVASERAQAFGDAALAALSGEEYGRLRVYVSGLPEAQGGSWPEPKPTRKARPRCRS